MNLVIFIDGVQMFVRNFGLSHLSAAFGDFGIEPCLQRGNSEPRNALKLSHPLRVI